MTDNLWRLPSALMALAVWLIVVGVLAPPPVMCGLLAAVLTYLVQEQRP